MKVHNHYYLIRLWR